MPSEVCGSWHEGSGCIIFFQLPHWILVLWYDDEKMSIESFNFFGGKHVWMLLAVHVQVTKCTLITSMIHWYSKRFFNNYTSFTFLEKQASMLCVNIRSFCRNSHKHIYKFAIHYVPKSCLHSVDFSWKNIYANFEDFQNIGNAFIFAAEFSVAFSAGRFLLKSLENCLQASLSRRWCHDTKESICSATRGVREKNPPIVVDSILTTKKYIPPKKKLELDKLTTALYCSFDATFAHWSQNHNTSCFGHLSGSPPLPPPFKCLIPDLNLSCHHFGVAGYSAPKCSGKEKRKRSTTALYFLRTVCDGTWTRQAPRDGFETSPNKMGK